MKKVINILSILLSLICAENIFAQSTVSITGPPSVEVGVPYNFTFEFEPDWQSGKYLENIPDSFTITEWKIRTGTTFYGQTIFGYMGDINNKSNLYTMFTNNNIPLTIPIQWGDGTFITNDFVEVKVSGHYSKTNYGVTKYFYDVTKKVDLKVERISPPAITGSANLLDCDQTTTTYSVNNYTNANQFEWMVSNGAQILGSNNGTSAAVKPPLTGNFDIKCTVKRTAANPNYSVSAIKTVTRTPKTVSYKTYPLNQTYFCKGTGLIFQIDNQASIESVNWNAPNCSVSNENIVNGKRQVTITPNSNGIYVNISANVQFIGGCVSVTPSKTFWAGPPPYQNINAVYQANYYGVNKGTNQEDINTGNNGGITFTVPYTAYSTSHKWRINGVNYPNVYGPSIVINVPTCGSGWPNYVIYTVEVEIANNCGTTIVCQQFKVNCSPSPGISSLGSCYQTPTEFYDLVSEAENFIISPNPSNNLLNVSQKIGAETESEPISFAPSKKPFNLKLYDANGKMLKKGESKTGDDLSMDVSSIPNGTYFLHIGQEKELIKKQIIIQH